MPALLLRESEHFMRGKQALPRQTVFAQWLYDARQERGLTMTALADRAGISHARIVQLEKGDAPTRDMAERLVAALAGEGADEHVYRALLNAGLKAAFPRPEDASETLSPAEALLRSTRAAQQAAESGEGLTEAVMDNLIDQIEKFAEFSVAQEAQKQSKT